ncbi:MAG: hypothetical protein Q8M16_12315 [Pirellulaceae bacterium]|nr:hypothetical protein [Pirellulaceae bacterium]
MTSKVSILGIVFATFFQWIVVEQADCVAQESATTLPVPVDTANVPVITREVILEKQISYANKSWANFSLGNLAAGKRYKVQLLVQNASTKDMSFASINAPCGCLKFESNSKLLPPGESTILTFLIDTPKRNIKTKIGSGVRFLDDMNEHVFGLDFNYELNSMFKILSSGVVVEVPEIANEAGVTVKLPVLLTSDVNPSELEVQVSENLRDLQVKFHYQDVENRHIELIVVGKNIIGSAISGELYLRRTGTEEYDSVSVVAKRREFVSIRPESLRLVKDLSDGSYTSRVVIRVDESTSEKPQDHEIAGDAQSYIRRKSILDRHRKQNSSCD